MTTVYFGGGTPTALSPEQITTLFSSLGKDFRISDGTECTVEANPDSLTREKLELLRSLGANRLSIGIQSFSDRLLRILGRPHTALQAAEAVRSARSAGFENVGIDLIYGIPGQSRSKWRETLSECLDLGPAHISAYCLSADGGSRLACETASGALSLPGDEESARLYDILVTTLRSAGYERYEISNFAKAGHECRHNVNYWSGGEYLGLGPSAWSFLGGQRRENIADAAAYARGLGAGRPPVGFSERPDEEQRAMEALFLSLRTARGLDLRRYENDHGAERTVRLRRNSGPLIDAGLIAIAEDSIRLAEKGVFVADDITARLCS